jgi:hypothetical protein
VGEESQEGRISSKGREKWAPAHSALHWTVTVTEFEVIVLLPLT